MKDRIEGLIVKENHVNAPAFCICKLSVKVEEFKKWLDSNQNNGWVNLEIKKSRDGKHYAELNDWVPNKQIAKEPQSQSFEDKYDIPKDVDCPF